MRLSDVDHKKVSNIAEVLDELLELLKFEDKRGSGAASKTQHQRPVACRYYNGVQNLRSTEGNTIAPKAGKLESHNSPFMYLQILVFSASMLNTGESGASPPTKASCPKDNHMW